MPSTDSSFPAHASPALEPQAYSPRSRAGRNISDFDLHDSYQRDDRTHKHRALDARANTNEIKIPHNELLGLGIADHHNHRYQSNHDDVPDDAIHPPPPSLLSPAFTPPATPGWTTPSYDSRPPRSVPVDTSLSTTPAPALLPTLPVVSCVVRARIPTTINEAGYHQEMFLHLYTNNVDNKEHLAIVFGPYIRSRSLDAPRPGETEMDRMIRGAYTGRLYPGRTTSRPVTSQSQASPMLQKLVKDRVNGPNAAGIDAGRERSPRTSMESVRSSNNADDEEAARATTSPKEAQHHDHPTETTTPPELEDDPFASNPPLVRIHSECYTGETVWSARCDCGEQLEEAARLMSIPLPSPTNTRARLPNPGGVIIYLRQEGRGIGLLEKLKAYNLQDLGSDTVDANLLLRHPADARSYGLATAMLQDLGLGGEKGIRLLTNNPEKVRAVEGPGREVKVRERVAMVPLAWKTGGKTGVKGIELEKYLRTKSERMSHMSLARDDS